MNEKQNEIFIELMNNIQLCMYEFVVNCPQSDERSLASLKDRLSGVVEEYEQRGKLINDASKRITFEPKPPMTYFGIVGEKAFLHMLIDGKQPVTSEEFAQFIPVQKFVKGYHFDDTMNYKLATNESFTMGCDPKAIVDYLKKEVTIMEKYKESECSALNRISEFAILNQLFHKLWTKAVGTDDYNKEEWMKLEKEILDYQVIKRDYVLKTIPKDEAKNNTFFNGHVKIFDHVLTNEEIAEEFKKGQEVWKEQYKYGPLDYPEAKIFDMETDADTKTGLDLAIVVFVK
jgi:hypothetical protein